jgi:50S ribosomal protein L4
MRYLFSNKTNTSRRIYIFFGFLLVVVLLGKFVSGIFFPAFSRVFFPAVSLGTDIDSKTSSWLRLLEPKSSLIKENEDLKTKVVELSSDNARLMRKISDYEAISSLIKKKDSKEGGVIGKVISLPDKSPFDTVLVSLISDGDVSVGDIAYGQNGVLIGKVERVSKDNATVRMFSSPGERHNVFIGGSKIFGEAVGRGGGVTFGPTGNENYSKKISLKAKRTAIRQALTLAAEHKNFVVIEDFAVKDGKTKTAVELLAKLNASSRTLVVVAAKSPEVVRAIKNIPEVTLVTANNLNVFNVMNATNIVISKDAIAAVDA